MPVTLADFTPQLQSLLDAPSHQAAIHNLEALWRQLLTENAGPPVGPEWERIAKLIADFGGFEPNPQWCNPAAGMYDANELERRVREVLAFLWR